MRKVSTLVGLIVFALAGSARAQNEAPAAAPAGDTAAAPAGDTAAAPAPAPEAVAAPAPVAAGTDYVSRGLTLGAGNLQVTLPIVLNLSKSAVLKPVWVPLDIRYGITDQLEVYLNHAAVPVGPIATPGGVCLGGTDRGCGKLYDNLNIGAQFSLMKNAGIELAVLAAFVLESLDASTYAADVGVNFKYATGPIAVKAAPQVLLGVNKRDAGNIKQVIYLPVQVAFQATPELAAFLDTGISGPTDGFGDGYQVPAGIGASFAVMPNLDVGGEFMLPTVLAPSAVPDDAKGINQRYLAVFAQWRLK
jgi:hypothetical protein